MDTHVHALTHARTHARTHACTHAHACARAHTQAGILVWEEALGPNTRVADFASELFMAQQRW